MITKDEIRKLMDEKELLKMDRYTGGHDEQMKGLVKGAKVISHWNEGDYQGQVATCLQLETGEFMVYSDYYGSCSGCDAWESANDEDVIKICNDLIYTSDIFKTLEEVKVFLNDERENWKKKLLEEMEIN